MRGNPRSKSSRWARDSRPWDSSSSSTGTTSSHGNGYSNGGASEGRGAAHDSHSGNSIALTLAAPAFSPGDLKAQSPRGSLFAKALQARRSPIRRRATLSECTLEAAYSSHPPAPELCAGTGTGTGAAGGSVSITGPTVVTNPTVVTSPTAVTDPTVVANPTAVTSSSAATGPSAVTSSSVVTGPSVATVISSVPGPSGTPALPSDAAVSAQQGSSEAPHEEARGLPEGEPAPVLASAASLDQWYHDMQLQQQQRQQQQQQQKDAQERHPSEWPNPCPIVRLDDEPPSPEQPKSFLMQELEMEVGSSFFADPGSFLKPELDQEEPLGNLAKASCLRAQGSVEAAHSPQRVAAGAATEGLAVAGECESQAAGVEACGAQKAAVGEVAADSEAVECSAVADSSESSTGVTGPGSVHPDASRESAKPTAASTSASDVDSLFLCPISKVCGMPQCRTVQYRVFSE